MINNLLCLKSVQFLVFVTLINFQITLLQINAVLFFCPLAVTRQNTCSYLQRHKEKNLQSSIYEEEYIKWFLMELNSSCRVPVDEHVVLKMGEQYPSTINDTRMIGEDINMVYTVTCGDVI